MKWLFGLLLLANLVFFAIMQWGGALVEGDGNMQPLQALNAEKINLQTGSSLAQAPVLSSPAAQSSVPELAAAACLEWGEFSGNDFTRASAALSALHLDGNLTQRQAEYVSSYWVYIPPLKGRAEVDKKISQLKVRGVEEYYVVNEAGKLQNSISLGIFKTEEAAQKFLVSLNAKGVISARVGERTSKLMVTFFELKSLGSEMAEKVRTLQAAFPGSELKAVDCNSVK